MRVAILSIHIVGVLILFIALALETVGLRQVRRSRAVEEATRWLTLFTSALRLYPAALAVILLTGAYLASNVGVWQHAWVRLSMATLMFVAIGGIIGTARVRALYRRSPTEAHTARCIDPRLHHRWLRTSVSARAAAALGIVYVMVGKPEFVLSLIVIVMAAGLGAAAATIRGWRVGQTTADNIATYAASRRQEV
jgi:hypothetical protein